MSAQEVLLGNSEREAFMTDRILRMHPVNSSIMRSKKTEHD